ncbi:hypothetical protein [Flammeovirga agarivorans]|uniref:DUF4374 domain-containing protein n=1 Tax=Flammeovirga agarivorans TaxID=2726742 RepID=A0A7X8XUZ8_9BACT|nr:hypothetical protein [Flammeovirga agarivorans]NLR90590.1 hypothetical protein [Flammeovirga agarivorans]
MKLSTTSKVAALMTAAAFFGLTSCDKNDEPSAGGGPTEKTVFHVAADVTDPDENVAVFMQPTTNVTDTTLTFMNNGYEMDGERSARVTAAGGRIYNLNYGTGQIYELEHDGNTSYTKVSEVDISHLVGTHPRYAAVSDEMLLAHNVVKTYNEENTEVQITLQIVKISIPGLNFNAENDFIEHDLGTFAIGDSFVGRVDAPVIMDNKVYYGTQYRLLGQPDNGEPSSDRPDAIATVVLDWPTLENPKTVTYEDSKGDTYGYRGKAMHVIDGFVYQINMTTQGSDAVITRLNNQGEYDTSYKFDITDKVGKAVSSINWHHAGEGKGYVALGDPNSDEDNIYEIAYIDVVAQDVQILNEVPKSDMWYYQSGAVDQGKYYMAISPVGADAYIWEFEGTTATKGAQLDGGNIFVQGIYK